MVKIQSLADKTRHIVSVVEEHSVFGKVEIDDPNITDVLGLWGFLPSGRIGRTAERGNSAIGHGIEECVLSVFPVTQLRRPRNSVV